MGVDSDKQPGKLQWLFTFLLKPRSLILGHFDFLNWVSGLSGASTLRKGSRDGGGERPLAESLLQIGQCGDPSVFSWTTGTSETSCYYVIQPTAGWGPFLNSWDLLLDIWV